MRIRNITAAFAGRHRGAGGRRWKNYAGARRSVKVHDREPQTVHEVRRIGSQLFEDTLEPRMAAERIQVAVMLEPVFVGQAVPDGSFKRIERILVFVRERLHTCDIVENHRFFRVDLERLTRPFHPLFIFAEWSKAGEACLTNTGPRIPPSSSPSQQSAFF